MAAIRERGGRYHVQVRVTGYPARTKSFPTERMAHRWATTIEAEMIEGRAFKNTEARRRSVADAITRYLEEELPKKKDAKTRLTRLNWWAAKIGHVKLGDVTPALLVQCRGKLMKETFTRARPGTPGSTLEPGEKAQEFARSGATVNRFLAYFAHVLSVARREWHWISGNPFEGVSKFAENTGRVRVLNEAERTRLLKHTAKDPTLHLLVTLALYTAARAGELINLTWGDVDLEDGRLLLRKTKNSQPRTAWVNGEALRLLKAHAPIDREGSARVFNSVKGKRYGYQSAFVAACTAARVEGFCFHSLRHTAATMLAREGASEQQLRAIGGWKSNIVSRYVHIAGEDVRSVVAQMNAKI